METKIATSMGTGDARQAAAALGEDLGRKLGGAQPALLLVFASTKQELGPLGGDLGRRFPQATVLGSSTAGEFTEQGDRKGSAAAIAIAGDFRVSAAMGRNLKADPDGAVAQAMAGLSAVAPGLPHRTALLLVDALAGRGEEATLLAAARLQALTGEEVPLAGGAAGDDLQMKETHVSVGGQAASDAIVIAMIHSARPLGVGVCHGHRPLSAPLKVTRAEGNVVREIEGRPAFDVWAERTAASAGTDARKLPDDQVGAFLLRYEAGLATGSEYKIRAPLARAEGGAISFACGIPEGAVIRITESEPTRQVDSAREAARRARARLDGPCAGAIVFDCICRNLILGDRFGEAVRGISDELGAAPLAGFETYGEIALSAGDMSGFHNTTTVVLALPR